MRLLVAEDEPDLRASLTRGLRAEGYAVDEAADGVEALYKAENSDYDTIVLDMMLPEMDGLEVLRKLRRSRRTPVLVLTARGGLEDRVQGLDVGADDYLTKPVDLRELSARIRALIRRTAGDASSIIAIGSISINTAARRVTISSAPISLTSREYSVLEYLALHRGKIVTRTDLYEHLHDENDTPVSNLVDVHVFSLRKKLGQDLIQTHRGQGYCIEQ